jgi:hypothetical protein
MTVQEQYLWKKEQCPMCGSVLPAPLKFKGKRKKASAPKKFNIMVEYKDLKTNELKSIIYTDVTEEYYNKIKYTAKNVVAVHTLTEEV